MEHEIFCLQAYAELFERQFCKISFGSIHILAEIFRLLPRSILSVINLYTKQSKVKHAIIFNFLHQCQYLPQDIVRTKRSLASTHQRRKDVHTQRDNSNNYSEESLFVLQLMQRVCNVRTECQETPCLPLQQKSEKIKLV